MRPNMSFIIPRAGRETAFWSSRTPVAVGPGTYAQVSPPAPRCVSVPFSVGSERPLSTMEGGQVHQNGPGPGSYDLSTRESHRWGGTSAFRNKVLRPEMPVGVKPSSDAVTNPGPGAYEMPGFREKDSFRRDYRRQKNSFLPVSLNPPSIPRPIFSLAETRETGPGSYEASEELVRSKGKASDFATSKVERKLWAGQDTPGPGHYSYRPRPRQTAAGVIGKDSRRSKDSTESSPGPGSYEPTLPGHISFSQKASFAAKAGRKPLWPEAPVPGVGTYNLRAPPLGPNQRHQFLQETGSNLRPAFLSAGERDCLRSEESRSPGPGAYEAESSLQMHNYSAHVESGKVKFMTTQARFKGLFEPKLGPDPGQYDQKGEEKAGETRSNTESRFRTYAKDNIHISVTGGQDTPAVGSYTLADPWTKTSAKVNRSKGPNRSFDSSSLRFDPRESFPGERLRDIPGPGYYRRTVSGYRVEVEGKTMGKSKRFGGYGDYRGEDRGGEDLGPGRYHQDQSLLRKSFNATTRSKD